LLPEGGEVDGMMEQVGTCPLTKGERILVALDGSDHSEKALDQAISMAKICNSQLFAIAVTDLYPEQMAVAESLVERVSEEVGEVLERAKQKAEAENVACETITHMGAPAYDFIVQEANKRNVDLIVMGTHGRTGFKRLLMGSVAERVIGAAPCPVLVTPL
jgi:nucleotide-binding universal stress UspA family protein